MPVNSIEEAKALIERWIGDRNLTDAREKDESLPTELNFKYDGKTEAGIKFAIVQPKTISAIIAVSRIEVAPNHFKALSSMKGRKLEDFLLDIKRELVFAPAAFLLIPTNNAPELIQFTKEVSFDELTEGRLTDALDSLVKCTVSLVLFLTKKLGPGKED